MRLKIWTRVYFKWVYGKIDRVTRTEVDMRVRSISRSWSFFNRKGVCFRVQERQNRQVTYFSFVCEIPWKILKLSSIFEGNLHRSSYKSIEVTTEHVTGDIWIKNTFYGFLFNTKLSEVSIKQVYGLYYWNSRNTI